MFMFTKGQSRRMDACLDGARASFLTAPAFALTGGGTGTGPSAPQAAAPALADAAVGAAAQAVPAQAQSSGDEELLRLRKEVEQLRQDNRKAMMILEGLRAALNSDNVNAAGG
jgi:hypothetical protein